MKQKLKEPGARAQWEQRSHIIEPRFAPLKQHDGFRRWTVWGLEGVRTQWSLLCATMNLRILCQRWQRNLRAGVQQVAVARRQLGTQFRASAGRLWPANSMVYSCAAS